ncbi:MAG: Fe-S cluster assembly protein SufD [Rhodothermales bacterium]
MASHSNDSHLLENRFRDLFNANVGKALNGHHAAIRHMRQEAIDRFLTLGFPNRKSERWKYTNLSQTLSHPFALRLENDPSGVTCEIVDRHAIPDLEVYRIVLVNGYFQPMLSDLAGLPAGVVVSGLDSAGQAHADLFNAHFAHYASHSDEPFIALNTAFVVGGLFVHVPAGLALTRPIHIHNIVTGASDVFVQPRQLIVAGELASCTFIESQYSLASARTFTNSVTEVAAGREARVAHHTIQRMRPEDTLLTTLHAYQEATSHLTVTTVTLDGGIVRNNLNMLPDAEGCETHLNGLVLGRHTMHVDNHTLVDHAKPNCFSNELYKHILDDQSTAVFNGKVLVRLDAQKTNAYQSNKSVTLTDRARMFSKPELEIYADDVKCSHGATTGQLDAEALFYLRSRGLNERQARALMLTAFARDVIETVKLEPLRAYLDREMERILQD